MKKKKKSPIWPYLGILACLFVLSVTAPRAWDRRHRASLPVADKGQAAAASEKSQPPVAHTAPDSSSEVASTEVIGPAAPSFPATGPSVTSDVLYRVADPSQESAQDEQVCFEPGPTADELAPSHEAATTPEVATSGAAILAPVAEPAVEHVAEPVVEPTPAPSAQPATPIVPPAPEFTEPVAETKPIEEPAAAASESTITEEPAPAAEPNVEEEPEPAPAAKPEPPKISYAWPLPRKLLADLALVAEQDPHARWAQQSIPLVHELCREGMANPHAGKILTQLSALAAPPAKNEEGVSLASRVVRAHYALYRWVSLWQAAARLSDTNQVQTADTAADERLQTAMTAVEKLMRTGTPGAAWRKYLKLDELRAVTELPAGDPKRRLAARKALDRLTSQRLTRAQQRFVNEQPISELREALQAWAAEPVSAARLLAHLEQYEQSGLESDARLVADDFRGLHWSAGDDALQAGQQLDTYYRNANVRVALSGSLINRLAPQPERINAPVRDRVMNVPVRGHSSTLAQISVRLVPDATRIRLGLEAQGTVDSDTISTSGPATLRNEGQSSFLVRKLFVLGPQGLVVWPSVAEAENNFNYLVSLETSFDGVPLVGSVVRSIARSQYDEARGQAQAEAAQKVAIRARNQLDAEIEPRLTKAAKAYEDKQGATLTRLGLELTPVAFSTTSQRVVARARVGTPEQLGGHTPRPQAPSDSWFSLQVHESALNNVLKQLDLDGRHFELPELFAWIGQKLGWAELGNLDELPEGVEVTFAKQDSIRVRCVDGCVELTISLAELVQEKRWRNFQVKAKYVPHAEGLAPLLEREGIIELPSRGMQGKFETRLRAIFSKVLSKNRDLRLLSESMTADPRLHDLEISQFQVEDGWIALAYAPARPANRTARPKTQTNTKR